MITLQDNPGEKKYQSHELLSYCPQRHTTLTDFFGLLKSNYWTGYV